MIYIHKNDLLEIYSSFFMASKLAMKIIAIFLCKLYLK